jgi:uncharacterized protein (DUF488 family)
MKAVYTIGHSTHSVEYFVELLKKAEITAIADVRSSPYSRRNPQFNREVLKNYLRRHGVAYAFLGTELGGRGGPWAEHDEYGRIKYQSIADSALFHDGLRRIQARSSRMRLALTCAENDPLECHRGILISKVLESQGVQVTHIHGNGRLESHRAAEDRLLRLYDLHDPDLFRTEEQMLLEAYERQELRIAYVAPNISPSEETVG